MRRASSVSGASAASPLLLRAAGVAAGASASSSSSSSSLGAAPARPCWAPVVCANAVKGTEPASAARMKANLRESRMVLYLQVRAPRGDEEPRFSEPRQPAHRRTTLSPKVLRGRKQ